MSEKLISADRLIRDLKGMLAEYDGITITGLIKSLQEAPAVDAVEVETIKAWLYEIAGNNLRTEKERQFSEFCEELISRLDGLRNFARERREENATQPEKQ